MPLVRVDMPAGRPAVRVPGRARRGRAGCPAQPLGVPLEELFQDIAEHGPGGLAIDPGYLGVSRSAEAVIVQIFLNRGRDADKKRRFFAALADALHGLGLRREDVVVSLVEVGREDWSFGNGEAQLA